MRLVILIPALLYTRVGGKAAISGFARDHKDAVEPLMHWYGIAKRGIGKTQAKQLAALLHVPVDVFL